jgi:hypothetical protein
MADKFQMPKVMVTPSMLKAGMDFMAKGMDSDEDISDQALVTGTFLAMWTAYWEEISATHKSKQAGSPIVKPTNLILPH